MKNNTHNHVFLKDYTPPLFLIESADVEFSLDSKETIVTSKLYIKRNSTIDNHDESITLDGSKLTLQAIKLNGQSLPSNKYLRTNETITISQVPDDFILETIVTINPEQNLSCSGLYLTNGNFCTQNEPCGFRRLTYFIDRPDILTKFTTTIIANKNNYPILLSNGNCIVQKELPNDRHCAIWQDPFPKSSYLFALVAGKFDLLEDYHVTTSGRKIVLRIFAETKQLEQCQHAMMSLKQAMSWDEENFGLEYDLDVYQIVAVDDFNFGAMENKGLNIFNSSMLLASQYTATDADFNKIASVVAHEYFHNWTGNRVTCRDWFQMGLKEGLTTLREQLFMEDLYGMTINRINSIKTIRTKQFAEDSGALSHPIRLQSYIEINNFYTVTIYYKSAEVARMLYTIFGKLSFQQIIRSFLAKFDRKAVTIEDFLQVAETVTKTNLEQFKLWYDQAGTLTLTINDDLIYADNIYALKIKQQHNQFQKDLYIPISIGLIQDNGYNTTTKILLVNKNEETFHFPNFTKKPIPSLLRNFSAPVKVDYPYNDNELLLLIQHDQDQINAWNASQQLAINILGHLYHSHLAKEPITNTNTLIQAYKIIINNHEIYPALAAQMLQMPTENYLLETLPHPNIKAIHYVSEYLKLELAKRLKNELLDCYKDNNENKAYSLDPISVGRRNLKNVCLYYLMQLNTHEIFTICLQQLEKSDNITDTISCLNTLANSNYHNREQLLEDYYQKWHYQTNLVNKWLAINASIKLPNTLQNMRKLIFHKAFNIKNPNKVYALIRTFCENNHINFHEQNGAGYKFLADQVITIDKFNPQLAASIILPLIRANKLDITQQQLSMQQLIRINNEPGLSKNVYEIVNRLLDKKIKR